MWKGILRRLSIPLLVSVLFLAFSGIAFAQEGPQTAELATAINIMWMLLAGFLVFFMQAGFCLLYTSRCV